jgi:hypothetical protein
MLIAVRKGANFAAKWGPLAASSCPILLCSCRRSDPQASKMRIDDAITADRALCAVGWVHPVLGIQQVQGESQVRLVAWFACNAGTVARVSASGTVRSARASANLPGKCRNSLLSSVSRQE